HDRAVVAAVLDPAVEGDGRPDVRGAQLAAGVRAFPGCHEGSALLYARPRGADTANCAPGRAPDATAAPPRRARAPCTPAVLEHRRRAFDPRPPAKVWKARARVSGRPTRRCARPAPRARPTPRTEPASAARAPEDAGARWRRTRGCGTRWPQLPTRVDSAAHGRPRAQRRTARRREGRRRHADPGPARSPRRREHRARLGTRPPCPAPAAGRARAG